MARSRRITALARRLPHGDLAFAERTTTKVEAARGVPGMERQTVSIETMSGFILKRRDRR